MILTLIQTQAGYLNLQALTFIDNRSTAERLIFGEDMIKKNKDAQNHTFSSRQTVSSLYTLR